MSGAWNFNGKSCISDLGRFSTLGDPVGSIALEIFYFGSMENVEGFTK